MARYWTWHIATEIEQADDYNHNIYEALVRMEEVLTPTGGNGRSLQGLDLEQKAALLRLAPHNSLRSRADPEEVRR